MIKQVKGAEEWSHIQGLLDCLLGGCEGDDTQQGAQAVEAAVREGEELLELLRQKSGGQPRARAPLLAAAELWSRLAALTQPPPVAGARAREAIVAYVEALGDRDACSYDLVQVSTRLETV